MTSTAHGTSTERARRTFWVTAGLLGGVLLLSIYAAMPANVLKPRAGTPLRYISTVMPQGWAFFTKDPQDIELVAYRSATEPATELVSLQATPQSLPKNLFGLSRAQRAQGPELAAIANELSWTECVPGTPTVDCYSEHMETVTVQAVDSPVAHPFLCGRVLLAEEKPVTWSFREFVDEDHTAERIAIADLNCPAEEP